MAERKKKEIKIEFPPHLRAGVYANNMVVSHTKEEFVLDFMLITSLDGVITARLITSPGHLKRIILALQENVKKYEAAYGKIEVGELPKGTKGYIPPVAH